MNPIEVFWGYFQHVQEDPERAIREQGGWRDHTYHSSLGRLLAYLQPWFDMQCPEGLYYKFFEFCRAGLMFFAWMYVVRLNIDAPGLYSGFDLFYPLRNP